MNNTTNTLNSIDIERIQEFLDSKERDDNLSRNTKDNIEPYVTYSNNNTISTNNVRNPPKNQFYRQLEIPNFDIELTGYFIGEKGKHFKRITNMAGVKYIWWDSNIKRIEIWGPERKLNLACNILKDHYTYILNRKNNV
tara:strand:+ start:474 stop:890 length:417 start_codon:yes stop_codon:yes gene_type:complete